MRCMTLFLHVKMYRLTFLVLVLFLIRQNNADKMCENRNDPITILKLLGEQSIANVVRDSSM